MKKFKLKHVIAFVMMMALVVALFTGCGEVTKKDTLAQTEPQGKKVTEVVDMTGRKLELPLEINKVYSTNPIGTIFMYSLAPDKISGWNSPLTNNEKKYINEKYHSLPVLGGWFGKGNTGNIEEIMKQKPDVILSMGSVDQSDIDKAEAIQKQTGIPVVMVKCNKLNDLSKAYELLGNITGDVERAKELAEYCNETLKDVEEKVKNIAEDKRVKVYYAEGPKGLQTDPANSPHAEVLNIAGGVNAAKIEAQKGYGCSEVSMEQVLTWNPDVIITAAESDKEDSCFLSSVFKSPEWSSVPAVKNGKVFGIPQYPFAWFDRPPSVNRIIGVKWLSNILYPEICNYDIKAEVKNFYDKFYHYSLSDAEIDSLLNIKK